MAEVINFFFSAGTENKTFFPGSALLAIQNVKQKSNNAKDIWL